ncbi:MAG: hypothetical protein Q8N81_06195, partial [bacterium]|nr:hypothetical protein [bacterium]
NGGSGPKSEIVNFTVDTQPPQVFEDKFSFLPDSVLPDVYKVAVAVSPDSVRTIVTVGADSAVLDNRGNGKWEGSVKLFNLGKSQNVPIEIFTQDLAGNETKKRVGWLNWGDVKGVFSSAQTPGSAQGGKFSIMGLVEIPNFDNFANNFYLYFVAFLTFSLMLMIGIKRHIQHPKTIAAASSVIMLAVLLFVI